MAHNMFNNTNTTRIKIHEFFVDYLREKHGINLYTKPANLEEAWIKFRYNMDGELFKELDYWYDKIRIRLRDSQETLQRVNYRLHDKWGITIDVPFDIEQLHSNDWRKTANALPTLKAVFEQLPTSEEIRTKSEEADRKEREAWVEELLKTAREQNSTFVVLKNLTYNPNAKNVECFNESVRKHEQCTLHMNCIGFGWLGCPVDKLSKMLLEGIGKDCLSRHSCTVDYIVD